MSNPQVSLVIITLNEAAGIRACIESAKWVDEVIVVDSDSTDGTPDIARSLGARVVNEKWRGFREQKAFACSLAKNDWILSLDGDEYLSPELSRELSQLTDFDSVDGFEMPRLSFALGRWIHHGGWYPDRQLRFFNRARAKWSAGHVHEHVEAPRRQRLSNAILHKPFDDLTEQIATNNRYSGLGARDLFDRGRRFSLLSLLGKPVSKFLETYVIKRGFLDGLAGFVIAVGAAYSVFLKFAKLWELEKLKVPSLQNETRSKTSKN